MKKAAVLLITIAMLASFSVAAMAEDSPPPAFPGDGLYTAMDALEQAQVETSEGLPEQVLLQNEFNNKRMEALEQAKEKAEDFGADVIEELMTYLGENEGNLGLIIAEMASGKELPVDDAALLEDIANDISERGQRLGQIAGDEEMPEGARAGAQKALDNMAEAAEKAAGAMGNRGEVGPPPGTESEGKGDGSSQDAAALSEGAPPADAPPVDAPPIEPPPADNPPEEALPVEDPPEDAPPLDAPPVDEEDPSNDAPPVDAPVDEPAPPTDPPAGR